MPIYEYTCGKCSERFEVLVRSSAEAKPRCPKCGSRKVEKCFSVCASHNGSKKSSSHGGGSSKCGCGSCSGGSCGTCRH